MDAATAIEVARLTLATALVVSLPLLGVALAVGLLVSILQAVTQVNELTLTFVPKIVGVLLVLLVTLPYLAAKLMNFTVEVFRMMGG